MFLCAAGALLMFMTANPILSILCSLTLGVIWFRAFESAYRIIVSAFLSVQWLQITTKVLVADIFNIDLSQPQMRKLGDTDAWFYVSQMMPEAIVLGFGAIMLISFGCRVFEPKFGAFRPNVSDLSPQKLFIGYLVLLVVSRFAGPYVGGGLAQPLIVLGELRFAFALMMLFLVVTNRRGTELFLVTVLLEIVFGFAGYFGGFRDVLLVMAAGLLILAPGYWSRIKVPIACSVIVGVVLGVVWSAVKIDYRKALSQGREAQVVTIDMTERFSALGNLISALGPDKIGNAVASLANRIAYVDILSDALNWVPEKQPFQEGALWEEPFRVMLTPRFLFPDKSKLPSDSERTMRFTGRWFASDREGTSVSMGYVADSYVDFGILGALGIPFLLGVLYGWLSKTLVGFDRSRDPAFQLGLLIVMLAPLQEFEMSNVKLLPGIVWAWIVCSLIALAVWPQLKRHLRTASFGGLTGGGRALTTGRH